ncbi:hypothetical protein [Neomegalonema sp.]|uniref:hypothetical protein n=1 Tax=Neomegalonema sp. TaxID=2039713 RepID=UPI00261FA076|nr:hypothetical protein [Neomegalonema sp.]MDD2867497.1 hypothetical protein [Neomegalonema sp.]
MDAILRGVPAYVWAGLIYVAALFGAGHLFNTAPDAGPALDRFFQSTIIQIPLINGTFALSWLTFFIVAGFISVGVETMRATRGVEDRSGNDWMSLVFTLAATVLFAAVPKFQTTAFLTVVLAGICDLLLDRYVGQKTARREIGLGGR